MKFPIVFDKVEGVVFDLGGVIFEGGPSLVKAFGPQQGLAQEPWDELRRELFIEGDHWDRVERAEDTLDNFAQTLIARMAGHGITITPHQARNFMRSPGSEAGMPIRPDVLDICQRLFQSMPTALLTNNIQEWREDWRSRLDLPNLFDVVLDSSDVGMRKPEPEIYRLVEEGLGLAGGQLLFVDDIGTNLKTAKALGWQTLKFDDQAVVLAELEKVMEGKTPRHPSGGPV